MKVFVECTQTYNTKWNAGISRVVRSIVKICLLHEEELQTFPVIFKDEKFVQLTSAIPFPINNETSQSPRGVIRTRVSNIIKSRFQNFVSKVAQALPFPFVLKFVYAPQTRFGLDRILAGPGNFFGKKIFAQTFEEEIFIESGDVILLLDASWRVGYWEKIAEYKAKGVIIVGVIYDVVPLTHPQYSTSYVVGSLKAWLLQAMPRVDAFIAISQTTAIEAKRCFAKLAKRNHHFSYFWLGSELDGESRNEALVDKKIRDLCDSRKPTYMFVSTIEPRKNHEYALAAFEKLWKSGMSANFLIVGKVGWKSAKFVSKVRSHPNIGKQLFMFNDVTDDGLAYLYERVQGLVYTSVAEGFGLPIIEGLQRGVPVFASDIPVFREIGEAGVTFVDLNDVSSLTNAITEHIGTGAERLKFPVNCLTWDQSFAQLHSEIKQIKYLLESR